MNSPLSSYLNELADEDDDPDDVDYTPEQDISPQKHHQAHLDRDHQSFRSNSRSNAKNGGNKRLNSDLDGDLEVYNREIAEGITEQEIEDIMRDLDMPIVANDNVVLNESQLGLKERSRSKNNINETNSSKDVEKGFQHSKEYRKDGKLDYSTSGVEKVLNLNRNKRRRNCDVQEHGCVSEELLMENEVSLGFTVLDDNEIFKSDDEGTNDEDYLPANNGDFEDEEEDDGKYRISTAELTDLVNDLQQHFCNEKSTPNSSGRKRKRNDNDNGNTLVVTPTKKTKSKNIFSIDYLSPNSTKTTPQSKKIQDNKPISDNCVDMVQSAHNSTLSQGLSPRVTGQTFQISAERKAIKDMNVRRKKNVFNFDDFIDANNVKSGTKFNQSDLASHSKQNKKLTTEASTDKIESRLNKISSIIISHQDLLTTNLRHLESSSTSTVQSSQNQTLKQDMDTIKLLQEQALNNLSSLIQSKHHPEKNYDAKKIQVMKPEVQNESSSAKLGKTKFTLAEDNLLFLGLLKYSQRDIEAIQKNFLPSKPITEIVNRYKNKAAADKESSIHYFKYNRQKIPVFTENEVRQFLLGLNTLITSKAVGCLKALINSNFESKKFFAAPSNAGFVVDLRKKIVELYLPHKSVQVLNYFVKFLLSKENSKDGLEQNDCRLFYQNLEERFAVKNIQDSSHFKQFLCHECSKIMELQSKTLLSMNEPANPSTKVADTYLFQT